MAKRTRSPGAGNLVVMLLPVITIIPAERAAAAAEEVGQPRHGLEGVAEGVARLALAAGLVVDPAAGHGALEVDAAPGGAPSPGRRSTCSRSRG
jgi:hypothetical protein